MADLLGNRGSLLYPILGSTISPPASLNAEVWAFLSAEGRTLVLRLVMVELTSLDVAALFFSGPSCFMLKTLYACAFVFCVEILVLSCCVFIVDYWSATHRRHTRLHESEFLKAVRVGAVVALAHCRRLLPLPARQLQGVTTQEQYNLMRRSFWMYSGGSPGEDL